MTTVGPSPLVAHVPHVLRDSPSTYATPLLTVRNLDRRRDTVEVISAWQSALLSPSSSPRSTHSVMSAPTHDVKPAPGRASTERDACSPVYRSPPPLPRLDTVTPIRDHHGSRHDAYAVHHAAQARPRTIPTGALVYPTPVSVTEGNQKTYVESLVRRPPHPELRHHHTQSAKRAQIPSHAEYAASSRHHIPAQSPEGHPVYHRAHSPRHSVQPEVRAAPSPYSPYRSSCFPPNVRGASVTHTGHTHHHLQGALGLSPYGSRPKLSIHSYATPHLHARDARDVRYHSAGVSRHALPFGAAREWARPGRAISPGGIKAPRKRADHHQLSVLTEAFVRSAYPSTKERDALARELGMTSRSVQIWFQNRRRAVKVEQQSTIQRAEADARAAVNVLPYLSHLSHQLMTPPQPHQSLDRLRPSTGLWNDRRSPGSSMTARELPFFGSPLSRRVAITSYGPSEPRDSIASPKQHSLGFPTPLASKAEALTLSDGRVYEACHEERKPMISSYCRAGSGCALEAREQVSPTGLARTGPKNSGLVGWFFNDPQGPRHRGEECSPKAELARRQEDVHMQ